MLSDLMVWSNVMICSAIVIRLMFFKRPDSQHQWWAAWLAYVIILAYASVPFRFLFAHYGPIHWASLLINSILCAAVFRANGNIAVIFYVLKPGRR